MKIAFSKFKLLIFSILFSAHFCQGALTANILAGTEMDLPFDTPTDRIDHSASDSPFAYVGAVAISTLAGQHYRGTGSALSPHWVLTAGHNVDLDDNGAADPGLGMTFQVSGSTQTYTASGFYPYPSFSGFANPSIRNDLALVYFAEELPAQSGYALLGMDLSIGAGVTLVGYGRSGYGNYGYTTNASLVDRRLGENIINALETDETGRAVVFRYTFDAPGTGLSLGNDRESIIGPGDSGGPLLVWDDGEYRLAGVNTFTEGYGGRFGDIGGGVVLETYLPWIFETTGIPEPGTSTLLLVTIFYLNRRRIQVQPVDLFPTEGIIS